MQLTDMHYGETESKDIKNDQALKSLLKIDEPNMVVITGDMVSGWMGKGKKGWFVKLWSRIIKWFTKDANGVKDVFYSIALGSHDKEADLTPLEIIQLESQNNQSLTTSMIGGTTHQYTLLGNNVKKKAHILAAFFYFDTGQDECSISENAKNGNCGPPIEIVKWYDNNLKILTTEHPNINIFVFFHIPQHETLFMQNSFESQGMTKDDFTGCSSVNPGIFNVSKKYSDFVQGHFQGHDHNSDQQSMWYGLTLSQGRKSGYGSYGPPEGISVGSKIIQLYLNDTMTRVEKWDTYIREENGKKITMFDQNEQEIKFNDKCDSSSDSVKHVENLKMKLDTGMLRLKYQHDEFSYLKYMNIKKDEEKRNYQEGVLTDLQVGGQHTCVLQFNLKADSNQYTSTHKFNKESNSDNTKYLNDKSLNINQFNLVYNNKANLPSCQNNECLNKDLICWGCNKYGQIEQSEDSKQLHSTLDTQGTGNDHTCILSHTHSLRCQGKDHVGQASPPAQYSTQSRFLNLNADISCAIGVNSIAACWGSLKTLHNFHNNLIYYRINVGQMHQCALVMSGGGQVICKDANPESKVADVPEQAADGQEWVSSGFEQACVVKNYRVLCWGGNDQGQLNVPNK